MEPIHESITSGNGTLHPGLRLPAIPPSMDESILYGQHISMFLWLPIKLFLGGSKGHPFFMNSPAKINVRQNRQ